MKAFRTLPGGGWRRGVCIVLAVGAMGAVAVPGVRLWQETAAHEWRLLGAGCAAALAALVLFAGWRHSLCGGGAETPPVRGSARSAKRSRVRRAGAVLGRMAAPVLAAKPRRSARIAGIPYPKEARRGHTLVVGAAGSGRKALIAELVAGIRARGGRCIVLDRTGDYTRRLFDPARDVLLNPLDARAAAWSPLRDGRGRGDFEAMAAALFPEPADAGGAVAALAARQLFVEAAEALRRRGDAGEGVLLDLLLDPAPGALARVLEGTPARPVLAGMHREVLFPARALLRHRLAALRFAPGGDFSIRDWAARGDGLLLLASPDDPNGRLRGLASAWTEIALGAMLSLDPDGARGLWMAVDEPEALHLLPSLLPALGEARGVGVRFAVGIGALGRLRARYGGDGARTVSGLCATRAAMAAADDETAAWASAGIGNETLAPAWRLRRLAPGRGVVRFPGRREAVEFSVKESRDRGAAARFVPVEGAWTFLDEAPAPPAPARKAPPPTGKSVKRTGEAARPPACASSANVGREDGERPEARAVRKRKRRDRGRWA